jgi:hypothetical protein
MTVTIQFGSLVLMEDPDSPTPIAGKRKGAATVRVTEKTLMSGRRVVRGSVRYGWKETYDCLGTWAEYMALIGMIGQQQTLAITGTPAGTLTRTKCQIGGDILYSESENPGYYHFSVTFVQDTSL